MNMFRCVLLALALACVSFASLATGPITYYVRADALNVRAAPINGVVIRKLGQGQEVKVYDNEGRWSRISPDGHAPEWVANRYLCSAPACWLPSRTTSPAVTRVSNYAPNGTRSRPSAPSYLNSEGSCPCSGVSNCYGPRGGRYCITSGGNKRYR